MYKYKSSSTNQQRAQLGFLSKTQKPKRSNRTRARILRERRKKAIAFSLFLDPPLFHESLQSCQQISIVMQRLTMQNLALCCLTNLAHFLENEHLLLDDLRPQLEEAERLDLDDDKDDPSFLDSFHFSSKQKLGGR